MTYRLFRKSNEMYEIAIKTCRSIHQSLEHKSISFNTIINNWKIEFRIQRSNILENNCEPNIEITS